MHRFLCISALCVISHTSQALAVDLGDNLLANPGFESAEETVGLPTTFHDWGGDVTEIVPAQDGVVPFDSGMLQFIGTTETGTGGQTSDILQYVDLAPLSKYVEAGRLSALLTANFNRVARIGSDDGVVVWLNDELVHSSLQYREYREGEDRKTVTLQEGHNKLLVKVDQSGGSWGFALEFVDKSSCPAEVRWVTY